MTSETSTTWCQAANTQTRLGGRRPWCRLPQCKAKLEGKGHGKNYHPQAGCGGIRRLAVGRCLSPALDVRPAESRASDLRDRSHLQRNRGQWPTSGRREFVRERAALF